MFDHLLEALPTEATSIVVGYSGGLDSTVLLHACARHPALQGRVRALHVHHGLSPNADRWYDHCQRQCRTLGIPFMGVRVSVTDGGNGIEEAARRARYEAFTAHTQAGDVLVLAHHEQDQLETFLMRLFRGSGLRGLTGMASKRPLNEHVTIERPWLAIARATLEAYAEQYGLNWIEDESNVDTGYTRNWWRHTVVTPIVQKHPHSQSFTRTLNQLQRDHLVLQHLLKPLIDEVCEPVSWPGCALLACNLDKLQQQPDIYWPYLLRGWLERCDVMSPSGQWINTVINEVLAAKVDAQPHVSVGGWQLQRHKQQLVLVDDDFLKQALSPQNIVLHEQTSIGWASGNICVKSQVGKGGIVPGEYQVVMAERVRELSLKADKRPTKSLKALFQEANIPVFLRATWPTLMHNGEIAALVGIAIAEPYFKDSGLCINWCAQEC